MNPLTSIALRRPRGTLVLWLVIVAAAALFALRLDGALSGGGFTNPRAEALLTQTSVQELFGDEPNQVVIVLASPDPLEPQLLVQVAAVVEESGAATVTTPDTNASWKSADGTAALMVGGFGGSNTDAQNLVPRLQEELDDLVGDNASAYVTGQAALDYQLNVHSKQDATRAELIVFPLLLVVLLLVFRSVVATLLPLLVAGSALAVASGVGYLATHVTEISNLYSNIVSMIGLAVAVDYSLFIIKRFREELAVGSEPGAAVRAAMTTAGRSVLFSGVAVILALASLFIPNVMAFTSIALGGIIVTVAALLVTMTALPAALALLGERIDRWRVRLPRRASVPTAAPTRFRRRYKIAGVASLLALAAAAVPVFGLTLQSPVASATILPTDDPARVGLEVADTRIGVNQLFPIQVVLTMPGGTTPAEALTVVSRVQQALGREDGVASVSSVMDAGMPAAQLAAALAAGQVTDAFASVWAYQGEQITTRLMVEPQDGPDSVRAHELVELIRTDLAHRLGGGVTVAVTGATAQGVDFDTTIEDAIPLIAILVFALTFVMLAVAFRSLLLPMLALLFNALVVGASLGALTMIQYLTSGAPLNSVTPILLFAVMFGLSMDYMVIIIARMLEAYRGGESFEGAVWLGARRTRAMINSAAIIMITVFLAFMTGQISIVREIGIGLAIAVALDAVVIRMLAMPALLAAIGPRVFGRRRPRGAAVHVEEQVLDSAGIV